MNEAGRKRWWRAAAVAVLGGGVVVSGWAGLSRSAAHPSDAPVNAPSPPVAPGGEVIQAVATEPAPPALPAMPPLPKPPESQPTAPPALPTVPPVDVVPSTPPLLPPLPSVPTTPAPTPPAETVKLPEPPKEPTKPVELPKLPDVPKPADAAKPTEQVKPIEPAKPIESVKPTEPVKPEVLSIPPVQPVLPPPSITPSLPPSSELAPSPSPAKSPESAQPKVSPPPVSDLQGGNTGNSVKTEKPGGVPAIPTARPAIPAPEPVKPVEVPPRDSEKFDFPVPNTAAPTPGDTTVTHINKTVAAAVLSGALFSLATPATAQTPGQGNQTQPDATTKKLEDIQKQLTTITEILSGRKDKDGYPIESSPGLVADLKKLSDRLAEVEKELNKMKKTQESSSLRPNTPTPGLNTGPGPAPAVVPARGIVRVVNEYPVQISIVVNGTSYRVAPTKTLDVEVPAGEFTYQLLESGGTPTKSAIKDKETVTLRIK